MKQIFYIALAAVISMAMTSCSSKEEKVEEDKPVKKENIIYGIDADGYTIEEKKVETGESWSTILEKFGIGVRKVLTLEKLAENHCPLRQIRAGNRYITFTRRDSTSVQLDHLVYDKNNIEYVVFSFVGDSVSVTPGRRPVSIVRTKKTATIKSSLWGAIMEAKLPYALAAEMEDIYEWTIDFFGIQEGDSFTVIYDEKFIDTVSVGVGRIWGAKFTHRKKDIYAIPFKQNGKIHYWERDGASLRKQFLKAPLKFSRISSGYTNARLHPVLRVYRPHHGIDYAAPLGTPVRAVADGVIIQKGPRGAAGHMVKIKHSGELVSGYLHLQKYGPGIETGKHVSQGQIIGYVGSSGRSTGPHLDFRLWKSGTPINPANVTQTSSEPLSKGARAQFNRVKEKVLAELEGDVPDSMKLKSL